MTELDRTIQTETEDDDFGDDSPTVEAARAFYEAFDWFNSALFGNKLPECLITMQRRKGSRGYFASEMFGHRHDAEVALDEIALNPATFLGRTDREIISTLVHEMAHLWQFHFGKPGRGRYHNKQWAAKMEELGLIPSHTGEPGGKRTGDHMTHYIMDGGPYDTKWKVLDDSGWVLNYQDRHRADRSKPGKVKCKYVCEGCKIHVWGKPDLHLVCQDCGQSLK